MNNFLANQSAKVSRKFFSLSRKLEYHHADLKIFNQRDCVETIHALLKFTKPKVVFDIGAHTGTWTYILQQMSRSLEQAVFFEPQAKHLPALKEISSLTGIATKIYSCGLGDSERKAKIYGGSPSASILTPANQQYYFPDSLLDEAEEVMISRLDDIFVSEKLPVPDLIKIDVQGYELNVLLGATKVLSQADYLVLEASFCELYQGQHSFWKILEFLEANHYKIIARGHEMWSGENSKELIQSDYVFANTLRVKNS